MSAGCGYRFSEGTFINLPPFHQKARLRKDRKSPKTPSLGQFLPSSSTRVSSLAERSSPFMCLRRLSLQFSSHPIPALAVYYWTHNAPARPRCVASQENNSSEFPLTLCFLCFPVVSASRASPLLSHQLSQGFKTMILSPFHMVNILHTLCLKSFL